MPEEGNIVEKNINRRVKLLAIPPEQILALFKEGMKFRKNFKIVSGAPSDAKVVNIINDPIRNQVMMVVKSATFDEVPVREVPPILTIDIEYGAVK